MAAIACEVAHQLNAQGIATEVVDPVLLKPLPESLVQNTEGIYLFVVIEDGIKSGGIGDSVRRLAAEHKVFTPIVSAGVGAEFLDHGKRVTLLEQEGLHPAVITKQVIETLQQLPTLSL
jgi:1-deoxy-D-xylulose-5-phosphate synthase